MPNKQPVESRSGSLSNQKKEPEEDSTYIRVDTLILNGQHHIQVEKNNHFNCLLTLQGDTIVKSEDYYFEAQYPDIDGDGYNDIRVYAFSNTPNQCDNYLYNKNNNSYTRIENCDLDIQHIKGTNFYFSYSRAGCADLNWESYLSKIENFKLIPYGYIYGQGCDVDVNENPQLIDIYQIRNPETGEKTLINRLPYQKFINAKMDKLNFIEHYWQENYKRFE